MITNKDKYTITRVEAQFSPDGQRLHPHDVSTRMADLDKLPDVPRANQPGRTEWAYGNVLTPWDAGMRFEVKGIHQRHIAAPYAVVRWTDRWASGGSTRKAKSTRSPKASNGSRKPATSIKGGMRS